MINFDYGLQVFSNDVTNIYMTVNSLLLFHEENPLTDEKSVMFGPLNCFNQVKTNSKFYKEEPLKHIQAEEQTKKEMAKDFYDPTETNHRIGFSLLVDPKNKRTNIKVKLSQLKFFVMPHVFKDVSEFALQALKKLDIKKLTQEQFQQQTAAEEQEEARKKAEKALGSKTFIKLNVSESILVLERRERSKKAIVTEMDFDVRLNTID